ncbi:hypothetical protein FHX42_004476 [Saccharopolyspora lacisalsi]|uniref:Uncharacterized protein n=1 Tax=Halosaccharopolyspora lacisalsi TaxID=1000566 RepID=A0A839DYP9_9PSEU|nr:hypothetical protein [Halosaccharopolyspora lacisalsi]MBA8827092.1 hypothetical protein [Halosaccharopolyspora lacisalsi]
MTQLTTADVAYLGEHLDEIKQALADNRPTAAFDRLRQLSSPAAAEEFLAMTAESIVTGQAA